MRPGTAIADAVYLLQRLIDDLEDGAQRSSTKRPVRNPIAKAVRSALYRPRVVTPKTRYSRKRKKPSE